jgi:RNA polymerase sigma-70 factor (ECF subfamily)
VLVLVLINGCCCGTHARREAFCAEAPETAAETEATVAAKAFCAGQVAMSSSFSAARFPVLPLSDRKATAESGVPRPDSATPDVSDETLLAQTAAGEQDALAILFQRYFHLTRGIASRILRDATEAEDLVQDLFLFLQRKCAIFDSSRSSARSWIIQMAYHRAIERRRYLTMRQFYSRDDAGGLRNQVVGTPTSETDYSAEAVFGRMDWGKAVGCLSDDQRETLRLHFFEGYSLSEIASRLGQPRGNVRHHYYRALDKLRKHMFGTTVQVVEGHKKQL